jgi:hypothetical protein
MPAMFFVLLLKSRIYCVVRQRSASPSPKFTPAKRNDLLVAAVANRATRAAEVLQVSECQLWSRYTYTGSELRAGWQQETPGVESPPL